MTSRTAKRWLPESALKSRNAYDAIVQCASRWSDDWIAKGRIEPAESWRKGNPSLGFVEAEYKDRIGLKLRPDRDHRLAGMVLGREVGSRDIRTPQDAQLVERLTEKALTDLLDALCKVFSPRAGAKDRSDATGEQVELALMLDRKTELIIISIDHANLTEFALKNARPPRARPASEPRAAALSDQPIQISALVGRTKIELAELSEIGVGDVLILDRPVTKPLDLTINNLTRGPESASLSLEHDRLTLSIERTADQW